MHECLVFYVRLIVISTDEVIRQVTLGSHERGLLLLRIRDELQLTLAAYETLYHSSAAFGARHLQHAESGKLALLGKVYSMDTLDMNI
jgi:dynein light intermediate chain, axonemal